MHTKLKSTTPPKVGTPKSMPALAGLMLGFAVFLLLPVAQWIDAMTTKRDVRVETYDAPPPPPPMVIEEQREEQAEQEQMEDLKTDAPPPSLDMLELSLSSNLSGISSGDVLIPTFDVGQDLENMIFEIKDLDERPRPIIQTTPQYPLDLRQNKVNGEVLVEFLVDPQGNVRNPKIIRSTNAGFNESVLRAVRTWRFEPGRKGGTAVTTRVRVPIPFNTK